MMSTVILRWSHILCFVSNFEQWAAARNLKFGANPKSNLNDPDILTQNNGNV